MDQPRVLLRWVPPFIRDRLRSSGTVRRLAEAALWSTVGALSVRLMGLLAGLLLARVVGKADFGKYGLIQATVGLSMIVTGLGMGPAATKFVAQLRSADPVRAGRILTLSLISALVLSGVAGIALFLLAPYVAGEILKDVALSGLLQIGAAVLIANTLVSVQMDALAGLEAFRAIARLGVIQGGLTFLGVAGGATAGGLEGALVGLAISAGITMVAAALALRSTASHCRISLPEGGWWAERGLLFSFGLPGVVASLLVVPVVWYGQVLLSEQPSGFSGLAEFAVASRWSQLAALVPGLICAGYLPVLSSMHQAATKQRLSLMWRTSGVAVATALLVAIVICAGSGWILRAYGPDFLQGRLVLMILMIQSVAESMNTVMRQSLTAMNRVWVRVGTNFLWGGACLLSVAVLVPKFGSIGLALSVVIAQILHLALQVPLAVRAMRGSEVQ